MRMSTRKRKNIILVILMVMLVGMTIGYSALSSYLTINGTSNITSDFKVVFTDIQDGTMNGATTVQKSFEATTATFQVKLDKPGSSAEYNVTVQNKGKLNAYLESIEGIDEANEKAPTDIKFKISGITRYTKLAVDESITFKVIVTFDESATSLPEESKQLTLKLNFAQDSGNTPETEPEGVTIVQATDSLLNISGSTYNYLDGTYLGGAQDSNYVWFNGFMWRIMGKNADESVRMITEENVTAIPWGADDTGEQYDSSYVNDWLNNYFYPKLKNKEYLVQQTWCSETTNDNSSVRTTCLNNLSTVPQYVGLLSLDEKNLAGGLSYLINSQYFWTLTPSIPSEVWRVNDDGNIYDSSVSNVNGFRPVINVLSEIIITGGNGTLSDPYMFEDKSSSVTGTLKDNSQIGEYVTYAGRNYRVVETSDNGTKLILDGYYDSDNDGTVDSSDEMSYGTNCTLCTTINEDNFINWLSNSNVQDKQKLASTTWYRGEHFDYGYNYKTNLESLSNPYDGSVGLIRVGEMLSGQSETILSKNHTVSNSVNNAQWYLTVTPYGSSDVWIVSDNSSADFYSVDTTFSLRPVINIGPDVQITSGNGTPNSPYQI